jgi:hypothetical protein
MNRLGIVLALALASVSSVACTASSDDEQEDVGQTEDKLLRAPTSSLTCHRFPEDTCISAGTYCRNHGGQLWCDLSGFCTCKYGVIQQFKAQ